MRRTSTKSRRHVRSDVVGYKGSVDVRFIQKGSNLTLVDGEVFTVQFRNGHALALRAVDGWLLIDGDSTLTVRPVTSRSIYLRPVGSVGGWIPDFAKPKLKGDLID